tara:strand:+ start:959 stop:1618 length:660 start_codon:yes stop_codon:yes gene_type:complete
MIKEKDFIQLDFTAKVKATDKIVDTTLENIGKKANLQKKEYGPIIICIGQGNLLESVEKELIGKTLKPITIELTPEKAFGKREFTKIDTISLPKFTKEKINPFPGLVVNVDGKMGTVKSVSGGRVRVDFNHPLAGKDLIYEVTPLKKIESKQDQVKAVLANSLNVPESIFEVTINENQAVITLPTPFNKEIEKILSDKIKELTGVKKSLFKTKQPLKDN